MPPHPSKPSSCSQWPFPSATWEREDGWWMRAFLLHSRRGIALLRQAQPFGGNRIHYWTTTMEPRNPPPVILDLDEKKRPELTVRGLIVGVIITLVFTAANVYFGLKAGLTFSTSIPAAVISMAILRS